MKVIVKVSNSFTRHEAFRSWMNRFLTLYFVPYAGEFIANAWSNTIVGATKLDFLPRPKMTVGINMPYDVKRGIGKGESLWRRVLFAFPLIALCCAANFTFNMTLSRIAPFLEKAMATGLTEGSFGTVSVRSDFSGIKGLDSFVRTFVAAFTPSICGLGHSKLFISWLEALY